MGKRNNTPFSRTDLTARSKYHRLIHKIEGRLTFFREQLDYRVNHSNYPEYASKFNAFSVLCDRHLINLHTVGNYFNYNKTLGDISLEERIQRANKAARMYDEAYEFVKLWPKDRWEHIEQVCNIEQPEQWLKQKNHPWLCRQLTESSFANAVQIQKIRLMLQCYDALKYQWAVCFQTLTLDREHYNEVFEKGSESWRTYIRTIERLVQRKCHGSHRRALKEESCFEYFCVTEEGGGHTSRLHFHVLLFMKELPDFRDPNDGLSLPINKLIQEFEKYWKYGYSDTVAVRFSNNDWYGKNGWAWPCDYSGQPIPETNLIKLVQYLIKYILKSKFNNKEIPWRTKSSRRLGKTSIRKTMSAMKTSRLYSLVLMTVYPSKIKLAGMKSPTKFIRDAALTELVKRYRSKRRKLLALKPDTRLKQVLRNSTLKKHNRKYQNSGNILAEILTGRDVSSYYIHENWIAAREELENAFPAVTPVTVSGGVTDGR